MVVGMLWSGLLLLLRFGVQGLEGPAPRICHRRALVDKAENRTRELECQCEGGKNRPCDFLTFVPLLDTADLRVRDPGKNAL